MPLLETSRTRLLTLAVPELSMLVRFAVLAELQDRADAPSARRQATQATFRSYASTRTIDWECWWPWLRQLAGTCVEQRRTS